MRDAIDCFIYELDDGASASAEASMEAGSRSRIASDERRFRVRVPAAGDI